MPIDFPMVVFNQSRADRYLKSQRKSNHDSGVCPFDIAYLLQVVRSYDTCNLRLFLNWAKRVGFKFDGQVQGLPWVMVLLRAKLSDDLWYVLVDHFNHMRVLNAVDCQGDSILIRLLKSGTLDPRWSILLGMTSINLLQKDAQGQSLLMLALAQGYTPVTRALVSKLDRQRYDYHDRDASGKTILYYALKGKCSASLECVLKRLAFSAWHEMDDTPTPLWFYAGLSNPWAFNQWLIKLPDIHQKIIIASEMLSYFMVSCIYFPLSSIKLLPLDNWMLRVNMAQLSDAIMDCLIKDQFDKAFYLIHQLRKTLIEFYMTSGVYWLKKTLSLGRERVHFLTIMELLFNGGLSPFKVVSPDQINCFQWCAQSQDLAKLGWQMDCLSLCVSYLDHFEQHSYLDGLLRWPMFKQNLSSGTGLPDAFVQYLYTCMKSTGGWRYHDYIQYDDFKTYHGLPILDVFQDWPHQLYAFVRYVDVHKPKDSLLINELCDCMVSKRHWPRLWVSLLQVEQLPYEIDFTLVEHRSWRKIWVEVCTLYQQYKKDNAVGLFVPIAHQAVIRLAFWRVFFSTLRKNYQPSRTLTQLLDGAKPAIVFKIYMNIEVLNELIAHKRACLMDLVATDVISQAWQSILQLGVDHEGLGLIPQVDWINLLLLLPLLDPQRLRDDNHFDWLQSLVQLKPLLQCLPDMFEYDGRRVLSWLTQCHRIFSEIELDQSSSVLWMFHGPMAVIKSGCNQADMLHFNQLAWIGERNSKHFLGVRTNHVSSNYIHDVHSSITLSKACVLSQPGFNYGSGWMYIMQMLNTFMHHASALQQSQTTTKMKLMAKANTLDQGHQIQIQDHIHPSLDCQQLHDNGHSSFVNQSEGLNFCQDVDVKNQSNHIKKKRLKKKNKSVIEMRVTQVIEQPQVLNANAGRCVASDYNQNQVGPVFEAKGKNPITLVDHHVQTDADGKFGHDLPTSGRSDQKTMALCLSEACAKNRALEKQLASMEGQLKQVKSIKSQSYQQYHQLYSYKSELAACQGKLAALNRRYDLILRQQQYDRSQRMIDQSRLCIALEGLKEADADLCMALDGHSVLQTTGSCSVTDQINHCVLDGDVVDVKHHSRPPLSGENPKLYTQDEHLCMPEVLSHASLYKTPPCQHSSRKAHQLNSGVKDNVLTPCQHRLLPLMRARFFSDSSIWLAQVMMLGSLLDGIHEVDRRSNDALVAQFSHIFHDVHQVLCFKPGDGLAIYFDMNGSWPWPFLNNICNHLDGHYQGLDVNSRIQLWYALLMCCVIDHSKRVNSIEFIPITKSHGYITARLRTSSSSDDDLLYQASLFQSRWVPNTFLPFFYRFADQYVDRDQSLIDMCALRGTSLS